MGGGAGKQDNRGPAVLAVVLLIGLFSCSGYVVHHVFHSTSDTSTSSDTSSLSSSSTYVPAPSPTAPRVITDPADDNFIDAIRGDGITLDHDEAILQAHAVCLFVGPPNGGSLFDAGQQVEAMHPDWGIVGATHFVDRSVQNYCPGRAP